jgi:adenosylhomocysteine nucleosidase
MRRSEGVKLLLICPVPIEYNACRDILRLQDVASVAACRTARARLGGVDVTAVESGPAKARAAAATAAACLICSPDLVVDTGSCAGLEPGSVIGQVVLATLCYEYDIGGAGIPVKMLPAMKLPSAFLQLDPSAQSALQREAVAIGRDAGVAVKAGIQACGELLVQSSVLRRTLRTLFQADAANWESAGVFVAALRSTVPALSIRVVTDLGDERALSDFRKHVTSQARQLFDFIRELAKRGWFGTFKEAWEGLSDERRGELFHSIWP